MWSKFMTFGTISAGVIAIIMILQFCKLLIDTVIRGYTLHSIYGWSIKLLGAIFSSITSLLIHMGTSSDIEKILPEDLEKNSIPLSNTNHTVITSEPRECIPPYAPIYPQNIASKSNDINNYKGNESYPQ